MSSVEDRNILKEIRNKLENDKISHVRIVAVDIDGVHRGKLIDKTKFLKSIEDQSIEGGIGN
jgi:hypothetical protein